jgi:para-nitrobenzyl esterase
MPALRARLWSAIIASGAALVLAVGALIAVQVIPAASAADRPPPCTAGTAVTTADGPVCGLVRDNVTQWLGIPYAAPPVGRLRWRPPQPPARWSTLRRSTSLGNECVQLYPGLPAGGSENCLFLDVWAPRGTTGRSDLPVLVHLHGGGFISGSGNSDNSLLVARGHEIVVSLNYRLGIFGFLADSAFGAHAGDYGLEDQQAALRWVQRNIAAFGGNPRLVTIFGESAGGSSVCDQIASPTAAGLFERAISASGEYSPLLGGEARLEVQDCKSVLPSQARADAAGAGLAAAVGCRHRPHVAACLRAVPVARLAAVSGRGFADAGHGTVAPTINGLTLTMPLRQALQTGHVNRVAVIAGTDRDEDLIGTATSARQYRRRIRAEYGKHGAQVLALYPLDRFGSPEIAWRTAAADADTVCPSLVTDADLARWMPVYGYELDDDDIPPYTGHTPEGAAHVGAWYLNPVTPALDADQQVLQNEEVASVTHFARYGTPTAPGTPSWPQFGTAHAEMVLAPAGDSAVMSVSQVMAIHHCGFWDQLAPLP